MIVVTGGAGFIGSNLIRGLNAACSVDNILVVDDLEQGDKHRNLNRLRFADYMDKADLVGALSGLGKIEAILHQGACSATTEPDGRYMMRNNYEYSKALLHYALEHAVPFIYASSAAVYGNGVDGFREEPACEYPLNVYGFSKLCFDNYVRRHVQVPSSPVVGLRYFNVYGPQEVHKGRMASVAYHLFTQLAAGEPMRLFEGSNGFLRDFVHVDDVVNVALHFFQRGGHGIYNCGTGQARSFADVAKTLRASHGGGAVEEIKFPDDLVGRYQKFTEADLTQLREAGCEVPFRSLEQGVASYHEVLKNSGGYLM